MSREKYLREVEEQKRFMVESKNIIAEFMKTAIYQKNRDCFFNDLDIARVMYEEQRKLDLLRVKLCEERGE